MTTPSLLSQLDERLLLWYLCILQPYLNGDVEEGGVEEFLAVPSDGLGRYRLHLLDNLIGVLVEELVHSLT